MRTKTRHIVLLLLVFSLLTGSVGVAGTQRFCAMLGMAIPSSAAAKKMEKMGCCSKKKKAPACPKPDKAPKTTSVSKKACCSEATTYQKLDVETSLKFSKVEFLAIAPALTSTFLLPPVTLATEANSWPLYSDSSPPLAGKDLLHRLHILNI
ncbi:hypothetical protein [Rufibacter quisquiliarum]|uniref:Uncharacterized protein n=1 Tax=Rufibacter quisquiliarum TaxID=1549639 RepID=A0A839GPN7_9BACT|nr:hypothetical protein [Rufibacter quisquiliarum]MBA9076408.1 hypothetical protein [Rufibacter quisquiliarum]